MDKVPRVLLDTNVLLYLINLDSEHRPSILSLLHAEAEGKIRVFFAAHSCKDFFYLSMKAPYSLSSGKASEWIGVFMDCYDMVELTTDICRGALFGATSDFEDNIVIESARMRSCDYVITYDKGLAKALETGEMRGVTAEEIAGLMDW